MSEGMREMSVVTAIVDDEDDDNDSEGLTDEQQAVVPGSVISENLAIVEVSKQKQYYISRKFRTINRSSTIYGFNDCLRFSKIRPDELKTRFDVAELAGTPNNDVANTASCGNIREYNFQHHHIHHPSRPLHLAQ
ncbi:unnamed protein product [Rotaria sp. Silwood1]|nr:unnamed protein product [Rotaria sp. Silwood1]CAF3626867.1 unnamed protein product [Rotaria sp. Silwood1]CAF4712105.1 unnamed protein product [Rotaria sp. Silwood1]CAF4804683.1 unnamed protein product [Rotaria sp. Silwood1]